MLLNIFTAIRQNLSASIKKDTQDYSREIIQIETRNYWGIWEVFFFDKSVPDLYSNIHLKVQIFN